MALLLLSRSIARHLSLPRAPLSKQVLLNSIVQYRMQPETTASTAKPPSSLSVSNDDDDAAAVVAQKKKTKPRWTRQQKRQHNHNQRQQRECLNQQTKPNDKQKRNEKKLPPHPPTTISLRERQLACAKKAYPTGSVRLVTNRNSDKEQDLSPLRVYTTCLPLHQQDPSTFAKPPCVYVQPLLVLDLNGILCHRIRKHKMVPGAKYRPSQANIADSRVVPRIHLVSFLNYLSAHFTLAVWTSAQSKTAKQLISLLIPESIAERLLFVWAQNKCDKLNPQATHPADVIFVKSLDKVWKEYPLWDARNTLLIDDSPEKCPHIENTLHPPPLNGQQKRQQQEELVVSRGSGLYGYGSVPAATNAEHTPAPTPSVLLDDDENERQQMRFFQWLVRQYLNIDHDRKDDFLMSFLRQHASEHMGWRGGRLPPTE